MSAPDGRLTPADTFVRRLRDREQLVGYWIGFDNPIGTERVASVGYDYVGVDGQHGVPRSGWAVAMMAVDASATSAGVLRVPSPDPIAIGAALDAGARAVVVPMVDTAEQARACVLATRHWPAGTRSAAGPVRAELRMGSVPAELDDAAACIVMIETLSALEHLDDICAVDGLAAVYVGPADLTVALGGRFFGDPAAAEDLALALKKVTEAAARAGIAAGIHCPDGGTAARRLADGFTFATVSSDITHLHAAARDHLAVARGAQPEVTAHRPGPVHDATELVGATPLLRVPLPGLSDGVALLAKLEMLNPVGSVKDRAALAMLRAAERSGALPTTGGTVVECSSGSTGISLAALCAVRGHRCIIVLPDNASEERRRILTAFGAEIVPVAAADGLPAAWRFAEELAAGIPGAWVPHQDQNPANVAAHHATTGPEIARACPDGVDVLVCGVGTGGTLTGVARYLAERGAVHVVAVEPERSAVMSGGEAGPHGIPGIGAGYVSDIMDMTLVDEVVTVPDAAAAATAIEVSRATGLLVGISSGAAAHAARQVASGGRFAGATVVTVFPDSGERYLAPAPS